MRRRRRRRASTKVEGQYKKCRTCHGTGVVPVANHHPQRCATCLGSGVAPRYGDLLLG